jgi:hypothetical protein
MFLTKEQILNFNDSKFEVVDVPEWGEGAQVRVGVMSGFARDQFEASVIGKNGGMNMQNIRAKLAAATLVDDSGKLMFSEADINKLGQKSGAALDRIFAVAQKLNRITDQEVEQLAKN